MNLGIAVDDAELVGSSNIAHLEGPPSIGNRGSLSADDHCCSIDRSAEGIHQLAGDLNRFWLLPTTGRWLRGLTAPEHCEERQNSATTVEFRAHDVLSFLPASV